MSRRRRWGRRISKVVTTLSVGVLLGFLVPTIYWAYAGSPAQVAGPTLTQDEADLARSFMVAYLTNDQATIRKYASDPTIGIRAAKEAATIQEARNLTLISSHRYAVVERFNFAVELVYADGTALIQGYRVHAGPTGLTVDAPPPTGSQ